MVTKMFDIGIKRVAAIVTGALNMFSWVLLTFLGLKRRLFKVANLFKNKVFPYCLSVSLYIAV